MVTYTIRNAKHLKWTEIYQINDVFQFVIKYEKIEILIVYKMELLKFRVEKWSYNFTSQLLKTY